MFFESWRRGCGIHVPWTGSYNKSALDMKILEMVVALRGDSGGTRREEDSKTGKSKGGVVSRMVDPTRSFWKTVLDTSTHPRVDLGYLPIQPGPSLTKRLSFRL